MSTMVSSSSPASSPTPTPPPSNLVSSSPHHHSSHSLSTKAGAILASAKSTLAEQSSRLALKHNTDLDLLDDLRMYLKNRCSIERDYSQQMVKLNQTYSKKTSPLLSYANSEDEISDVKTVYTSWRIYQEEMEKHAKQRLAQFDQLASICEQLKLLRNHKVHVTKKCLDSHLKKMQEEIISSVSEIDKTRKLYFEEEHLAKQARDKEEKIKKRKTGIFSSFTSLQNRKERTSAHREASDIQSTQARNEYILALAAGNAHLTHYHEQDLVNLMTSVDDCALDKCRGFMINLLQVEQDAISSWNDIANKCSGLLSTTSADFTNSVFLKDPNSAAINETLLFEFQPCDNDPLESVSLEHNADIALRNEGQKWFQWFSKECRNLNRLCAQLVKLQAMQNEGHKTVEVAGSGSVDLESRIDELRQQIRKSEISKMKAKARLQIIHDSGAEVEDFEAFEAQVANEIKQQSLDVEITIGNLSRTSSVRSNIGLSESKSPTFNKSEFESSSSHHRPESSSSVEQLDSPDREVLQMGSSMECTSPAPTGFVNSSEVHPSMGWDSSPYDPAQAWDEGPAADDSNITSNYNGHDAAEPATDYVDSSKDDQPHHGEYEHHYDQQHHEITVDASTLQGKQCYAIFAYEGQTEEDLAVGEQDIVTVISAVDADWVQAQDSSGNVGYVPASYLRLMPEQEESRPAVEVVEAEITVTVSQTQFSSESHFELSIAPEPTVTDHHHHHHHHAHHEPGVQYATAIYDYVATSAEEISFKAGESIQIVENFSDDGWWTGKNEAGEVGHFPSMLVHGPDHDADEEEEESDEEESEEENSTKEVPSFAAPSVAPPPSIAPPSAGPPSLPSEDSFSSSFPPPPALPVLPEAPEPGSLPPAFAPPPKPMTLMAPQTVVIIQPTPEIENRPMLGSEEAGGKPGIAGEEVSVALAIAAHEIATDITQQAMEDSMAEISRRASLEVSPEISIAAQQPPPEPANNDEVPAPPAEVETPTIAPAIEEDLPAGDDLPLPPAPEPMESLIDVGDPVLQNDEPAIEEEDCK